MRAGSAAEHRDRILVVDLANIGHQTYYRAVRDESAPTSEPEVTNYFSRAILIAIMNAVGRLKPDKVIVACESDCWRKECYPEYKANRDNRKKPEVINRSIDVSSDFLHNYTSCQVVKANGAEGDDIIGILTEEIKDSDIIIFSNDGDFDQLLAHDHVSIFDPRKREFRFESEDFKLFLKYWRGDGGDNIPNISNRKRETFIRGLYDDPNSFEKYLDENDGLRESFLLNKKLITLSSEHIPFDVVDRVRVKIKAFNYKPKKQRLSLEMLNSKNELLKTIIKTLSL